MPMTVGSTWEVPQSRQFGREQDDVSALGILEGRARSSLLTRSCTPSLWWRSRRQSKALPQTRMTQHSKRTLELVSKPPLLYGSKTENVRLVRFKYLRRLSNLSSLKSIMLWWKRHMKQSHPAQIQKT